MQVFLPTSGSIERSKPDLSIIQTSQYYAKSLLRLSDAPYDVRQAFPSVCHSLILACTRAHRGLVMVGPHRNQAKPFRGSGPVPQE